MKKIIALPLFALFLWGSYFYYSKTNFHTVIQNKFYRSAQLDVNSLKHTITEHKIATVINMRGTNPEDEWYIQEKQATLSVNAKHVDIKFTAYGLPKISRVKDLINLLQSQPKPILIHCNGGADRAGLASIIVLLLEAKQSLSDIEKQVSWRYLAIKERSTGKLFLAQYRRWLNTHKLQHTTQVFLNWLNHAYIDDHGNMLFTLEQINGVVVADNNEDELPIVYLKRANNKQIQITGWTINYLDKTLPLDVKVLLDRKPVITMLTRISRPGVVKAYGHPEFNNSGWKAIQKTRDLKDGCYDVQLAFTRAINKTWISPTKARVCITSEE